MEEETVLHICIIFKIFFLNNWHWRWDKRMIRKWDHSFQNRAMWRIKHKSVAKCLIELLTKLNMLGASCNSSCNWKMVEGYFPKIVSTKNFNSVKKKMNYVLDTLNFRETRGRKFQCFPQKTFYHLFSACSSWLYLEILMIWSYIWICVINITKDCFHTSHVCSWVQF